MARLQADPTSEPSPGSPRGTPPAEPGSPAHLAQALARAGTRHSLPRGRSRRDDTIDVTTGAGAARAELRASAMAFTRSLRAAGLAPERTLVAVKAAIREGMPTGLHPGAARELSEAVVRWAIAAYYDAT